MKELLEIFLSNPYIYFIGLILVGGYFFFKKKFENLADKDDVADITREVENVKKEFNEDLEKLKSDLDIIKADKIALSNDKRKAIYDFWYSINNFEHSLSNIFSYNFEDVEDYYSFKKDLDESSNEFNFRNSVLELLINESIDEEFIDLKSEISDLLINLKHDLLDIALNINEYKNDEESEISDYEKILDDYKEKYHNYTINFLKCKALMRVFLVKVLN